MSNEKDANDPPTEDPEEPDESGVGTPDPTGNGEDARDDGAPRAGGRRRRRARRYRRPGLR